MADALDMEKVVHNYLQDCSDAKEFRFALRCPSCKQLWHSSPVAFSKAGITPESEGKSIIYEALYQREKERAREKAVKEAMKVFCYCPICKRLVCDRCFVICEDIDICVDCADQLKQQGEPVAARNTLS